MIKITEKEGVRCAFVQHGKVNAIDLRLCEQLIGLVRDFESNQSLKCLIIASDCPNRVFSAGIDLKQIVDSPPRYTAEYLPRLIELFETYYFCRKPTIAVVEGVAIAGGCILATSCTKRLATDEASFGMPSKNLDVSIPQIAKTILRSATTEEMAKRLHDGYVCIGDEIVESGIVAEFTPQATIVDDAFAMAEQLVDSFDPVERDEEMLEFFQEADQRMIEDWCSEELRSHVRSYVHSKFR